MSEQTDCMVGNGHQLQTNQSVLSQLVCSSNHVSVSDLYQPPSPEEPEHSVFIIPDLQDKSSRELQGMVIEPIDCSELVAYPNAAALSGISSSSVTNISTHNSEYSFISTFDNSLSNVNGIGHLPLSSIFHTSETDSEVALTLASLGDPKNDKLDLPTAYNQPDSCFDASTSIESTFLATNITATTASDHSNSTQVLATADSVIKSLGQEECRTTEFPDIPASGIISSPNTEYRPTLVLRSRKGRGTNISQKYHDFPDPEKIGKKKRKKELTKKKILRHLSHDFNDSEVRQTDLETELVSCKMAKHLLPDISSQFVLSQSLPGCQTTTSCTSSLYSSAVRLTELPTVGGSRSPPDTSCILTNDGSSIVKIREPTVKDIQSPNLNVTSKKILLDKHVINLPLSSNDNTHSAIDSKISTSALNASQVCVSSLNISAGNTSAHNFIDLSSHLDCIVAPQIIHDIAPSHSNIPSCNIPFPASFIGCSSTNILSTSHLGVAPSSLGNTHTHVNSIPTHLNYSPSHTNESSNKNDGTSSHHDTPCHIMTTPVHQTDATPLHHNTPVHVGNTPMTPSHHCNTTLHFSDATIHQSASSPSQQSSPNHSYSSSMLIHNANHTQSKESNVINRIASPSHLVNSSTSSVLNRSYDCVLLDVNSSNSNLANFPNSTIHISTSGSDLSYDQTGCENGSILTVDQHRSLQATSHFSDQVQQPTTISFSGSNSCTGTYFTVSSPIFSSSMSNRHSADLNMLTISDSSFQQHNSTVVPDALSNSTINVSEAEHISPLSKTSKANSIVHHTFCDLSSYPVTTSTHVTEKCSSHRSGTCHGAAKVGVNKSGPDGLMLLHQPVTSASQKENLLGQLLKASEHCEPASLIPAGVVNDVIPAVGYRSVYFVFCALLDLRTCYLIFINYQKKNKYIVYS